MMTELLKSVAAHGTLVLTLAHPRRGNALGPELVQALTDHVEAACGDASLHTVVLKGEGTHFCTGLDLSELASLSDGDLLWRLVQIERLLSLIWNAPVRTVALAQGRTWGAGADLFAACEHRLVMPGTTFRFPGVHFGIALGTRRLAERLGVDAARRCLLEGQELTAEQAFAAGLAHDCVADLHEALQALPAPQVGREVSARVRAASRFDAASQADADLAHLVRSAARPGLKVRIEAYRASLK